MICSAGRLRPGRLGDRRALASVAPTLTEDRSGMLGAVTARAEAQLALIYAVLDGAALIARPHLEAALEVWRYCDESAAYIFGGPAR